MSSTYIPVALRRFVEERANYGCEYCQIQHNISFFPHEIDHAIAEKHGGQTHEMNLAYSCWRCNRHKGTDLGSFDPQTGKFSFLFNPRTQQWSDHFTHEDLAANTRQYSEMPNTAYKCFCSSKSSAKVVSAIAPTKSGTRH